jgi:hypothetical protein
VEYSRGFRQVKSLFGGRIKTFSGDVPLVPPDRPACRAVLLAVHRLLLVSLLTFLGDLVSIGVWDLRIFR